MLYIFISLFFFFRVGTTLAKPIPPATYPLDTHNLSTRVTSKKIMKSNTEQYNVDDMNMYLTIHTKGTLLTHYEQDPTLMLSNSETEVTVIFPPSNAVSPSEYCMYVVRHLAWA